MTSVAVSRGLTPARTVLDNGIVILAQEYAGLPTVALNATFQTGSIADPPDLPGTAYLVRRTIDRGTTTRSAADIARALDDRGVSLRLTVTRHTFSISCVCLTEDFRDLLALLADIVRRPLFPEDEIDKRRLEAITSIREDSDDPAVVARQLLFETLYCGHPYGRPVKGTTDSLGAIGREALRRYHRHHLVPAALRIAIAGDVDARSAASTVAWSLADWRGPERRPQATPEPSPRYRRIVRRRSLPGKAQSDLAYGFATIARSDPRYYAYWILNNILGQFGLGGRLADNIRERQGMAYYAYSTLESMPAASPLVIHAGVDPANVERAVAAIDHEVGALGEDGPTADELEASRESLIGSVPRMLETHESVAEFLLYAERFGLGADYDRRLPELLRRVTIDDVRFAARHVLDPRRAVAAVAGPAS